MLVVVTVDSEGGGVVTVELEDSVPELGVLVDTVLLSPGVVELENVYDVRVLVELELRLPLGVVVIVSVEVVPGVSGVLDVGTELQRRDRSG